MKTRITIATILLLLGAVIHIVGGELTDMKMLLKLGLPDNIELEIYAVWYLVGIDFLFIRLHKINYTGTAD